MKKKNKLKKRTKVEDELNEEKNASISSLFLSEKNSISGHVLNRAGVAVPATEKKEEEEEDREVIDDGFHDQKLDSLFSPSSFVSLPVTCYFIRKEVEEKGLRERQFV